MKHSFWYQPSLTFFSFCLLPFSILFRGIVALRRFFYRMHLKKSTHFSVPIIVVGNITVGGTGKTPFVIWLSHFLREKGFTPGIVSRGVGGKMQRAPRWVNVDSDVYEMGDEAILLAKRSGSPVVIGIDRVAAVKELLAKTNCNIVISDDGLQHYRLGRNIEIALIDGMRGLGNQQLLPAGPLREPVSRLKEVDFVVWTGREMTLSATEFISVKDETHKISLHQWEKKRVHAVAGIGNPKRFFDMLKAMDFDVIEHAFPDHYIFGKKDLNFSDELPIVMTEKDAVKCHFFANEEYWYVPVTANLNADFVLKFEKKLKMCCILSN